MKTKIILINFLLFIVGCKSETEEINIFDTFSSDDKLSYSQSLSIWEKLKGEKKDAYDYTITKQYPSGETSKTLINVSSKNTVKRRRYWRFKIDGTLVEQFQEWITPENTDSIHQNDPKYSKYKLGYHENGALVQTIDDYYYDCSNHYLKLSSNSNELVFTTNANGILNRCGAITSKKNSTENSFNGIIISDFGWNKDRIEKGLSQIDELKKEIRLMTEKSYANSPEDCNYIAVDLLCGPLLAYGSQNINIVHLKKLNKKIDSLRGEPGLFKYCRAILPSPERIEWKVKNGKCYSSGFSLK